MSACVTCKKECKDPIKGTFMGHEMPFCNEICISECNLQISYKKKVIVSDCSTLIIEKDEKRLTELRVGDGNEIWCKNHDDLNVVKSIQLEKWFEVLCRCTSKHKKEIVLADVGKKIIYCSVHKCEICPEYRTDFTKVLS